MIVMGIDIGGTGIKGAPVDLELGALAADRFRIDTPKPSNPQAVAEVVAKVVSHHGWSGPVGITFPGVVTHGVVRTAANVDPSWVDFDADVFFTGRLGMPVHLLNDADAAGVAEMRFGAGVGRAGTVLMVTLGTGIGTALFYDGVLVPNTELGHLELDGRDAEERAAGRARERGKLTWKEYAKRVQRYLRHVDSLLWPELIIVGGGVSKEAEKWLPLVSVRCEVVVAQSLNNAGIIGAAAVAAQVLGSTSP